MRERLQSTQAKELIELVLMSDTHEQHKKVDVPHGDLLIHAGDFTYFNRSPSVVRDFNEWLHARPHRYKVLVPGNHEFGAVSSEWRDQITGAVVLINEGIELAGLKIWGSSIPPNERVYDRIPDGTDVLITHGPPWGILDRGAGPDGPQGCPRLLAAVRRIKPRIHVFGHVHEGYGQMRSAGTMFVNAALAEPGYALTRQPIAISIAL
jgi:predicted phosphodiesterase